jgi:hypothetical protein
VARWQSYATHHSAALFSSRPDKRYTVLYMHPQQQEMAPCPCLRNLFPKANKTNHDVHMGRVFSIFVCNHFSPPLHLGCSSHLHTVSPPRVQCFFSLAWSSSSRSQKNAFFRACSSSLSNQEHARVVINSSVGETTNQIDTRRNA